MSGRITIPKLRWGIGLLLLAITLINYTDRMALGVLLGEIRRGLHLTDVDYSQITSLFLVAYAVMYAGSGYVVDRLGSRLGMALFVSVWSICQMLHGLARGKWSFAACRFGLGLAEPGSFPAGVKAIGEWFPARQRALGVGLFNTGSALGSALAVPLVAFLSLHYGWRAAFVVTGATGLIWLAVWLVIYQPPWSNRWLGPKEAAELRGRIPVDAGPVTRQRVDWLGVLSGRAGLSLILARFLTDPVIYFMIFWLPSYLEKERGFDLHGIERYAWLPYFVGGFGYLIGGWISERMMQAGRGAAVSRKIAMTIGAALLPTAILAPLAPSASLAIAASCAVVLGHAVWITNLMTLPTDLFPPNEVGTASGFSGMGGAIGGALASLCTGWIVARFSYRPIFLCAGLLHPLTLLTVWFLMPNRPARSEAMALTNSGEAARGKE